METAIELAEAIVREKLSVPERERVIDMATEAQDEPVEKIVKIAKEEKTEMEITFHLHAQYVGGIKRASQEAGQDPPGLAKDIIQVWLAERKYA